MSNLNLSNNKFLIIVAGPTAVGKTRLSINLAKHYQSEIFSADSRQLYRQMSIGTAKPSEEELSQVKHHFIDMADISSPYTVGHYAEDIRKTLAIYFQQHDVAVVTGGTGLYLRALLEGLDEFPDVAPDIYDIYQQKLDIYGLDWLLNLLKELDPDYYDVVDKSNPRRIIRALGVIHVSGKPYTSFINTTRNDTLPYHVIEILLEIPRQELYERIDKRVEEMLTAGLIEEARNLYPYKGLRALETVGYQELFTYFEGACTLDDATALIQQNSRRYAKRQMTWFRKYGNWQIFHPAHFNAIVKYIDSIISGRVSS